MNSLVKILVPILFLNIGLVQSQTVNEIEKQTLFTKAFGLAYFFTPHAKYKTEDWENFLLVSFQELKNARTESETILTINSLFDSINCPILIDKVPQSDAIRQLEQKRKVYSWEHNGYGMGKDKLPRITQLITKLIGYKSEIVTTKQDFLIQDEIELSNGYYCHFNPQITKVNELKILENATDTSSVTHNLAVICYTWNALNYFYPYSDFLGIDWDAELTHFLKDVLSGRDLQDVLNDLSALLVDAHASFTADSHFTKGFYFPKGAYFPIEIEFLSNQHVIAHVSDEYETELEAGDILRSVNNEKIDSVIEKILPFYSGKRTTSLELISNDDLFFNLFFHFGTDSLDLVFNSNNGQEKHVVLKKIENTFERTNQNYTESHGYIYIDANTLRGKDFKKNLSLIENSKGVFFDMRSRPTNDFIRVLGYFTDTNIVQRDLITARVTSPKSECNSSIETTGIRVKSKKKQLEVPLYFIIGGGLYSAGEGCLEVIELGNLGTTIGSNSGGCNGDIRFGEIFDVTFAWTGRLVLDNRKDIFHGIGYRPNVPFEFIPEHVNKVKLIEDVLLELGIAVD